MKRIVPIFVSLVLAIAACEKEDDGNKSIAQGDFPVKEYYLERNPSVNPWGAGMDFIHDECTLVETSLDYLYLTNDTVNPYDVKFYTVKAYYTDNKGDILSEGCPAMFLGIGVTACEVGKGIGYFDSLTVITPEMIASLVSEPEVDSEACKDTSGNYSRELLFEAIDKCVIGRSFRGGVLEIPDGTAEQDVQPVYLIKTSEGGYAKFMVRQFKGDIPKEKQTLVRWQVISE